MTSLVQRVGESAANAIEAFRKAARDFTAEYSWLQANPPAFVAAPEIWREYDSLLSRSRIIGGTLQAITKTIDAIVGTFWRTTGNDLAGIGLGAFPLVPVAVIAGGTATLISGITAIRKFRERMTVFNQLRASGTVPADEAWKRAAAAVQEPNTIERTVTNVAMVAGGVVILLMILKGKSR